MSNFTLLKGISTFTQFHFCLCPDFFVAAPLVAWQTCSDFLFSGMASKAQLRLGFSCLWVVSPTWICLEEMLGKKWTKKSLSPEWWLATHGDFHPMGPSNPKKTITFNNQIQVEWRSPQWCCYRIFQGMVGGGNSKMVSHHVSLIFLWVWVRKKTTNLWTKPSWISQKRSYLR